MTDTRWRCEECGHVCTEAEMLIAAHPFDPEDTIAGCPNCLSADRLRWACDYPGCDNQASSGNPMPDGSYAHRCWTHSPQNPAYTSPPEPPQI